MEHRKDEERRGRVHSKDPQLEGSQELLGTKRCLWFYSGLMGLGLFFPCFWIVFESFHEFRTYVVESLSLGALSGERKSHFSFV